MKQLSTEYRPIAHHTPAHIQGKSCCRMFYEYSVCVRAHSGMHAYVQDFVFCNNKSKDVLRGAQIATRSHINRLHTVTNVNHEFLAIM